MERNYLNGLVVAGGAAALHFNNNNLITFALEIVRWNTKDEMRVRGNSEWSASWVDIGACSHSVECNRKNCVFMTSSDFTRHLKCIISRMGKREIGIGRCAVNHWWVDGGKWKWHKRTAICSNKCRSWQRAQTHAHTSSDETLCVDLTFVMTISSRYNTVSAHKR